MYIKNKKGQSTVEYILLVTAVIAVIILFTNGRNSVFSQHLNKTLDTTANTMETLAGKFAATH